MPLHPNDTIGHEKREYDKLLKDRKKYVTSLLKQNFDKYRKESRDIP